MQNGGVAYADDAVSKRLPASFTPDGDDEAGQIIAVSRQRRRTHATHKRQNTCKATVRQSQISTSLPLQDTDVLQSQLLSAHILAHTRQTGCKRTHTRSHPVRQSRSCTPLLYHNNRLVLLFSGGIVSSPEKMDKQRKRTEERKRTSRQDHYGNF